jgi:hypothetical protein
MFQIPFVTNDGKNAFAKACGFEISYQLEEEEEEGTKSLKLPYQVTSIYAREDFIFVGCGKFVFLIVLKMLQSPLHEFIPCVISGTQDCTEIIYKEDDRTVVTVNQDVSVKEWNVEFRAEKWRMVEKIFY